jgi:hypothetical protein
MSSNIGDADSIWFVADRPDELERGFQGVVSSHSVFPPAHPYAGRLSWLAQVCAII